MDWFQYLRVGIRSVLCLAVSSVHVATADQKLGTTEVANRVAFTQSPGSAEMLEAERALLESLTARKATPPVKEPVKAKDAPADLVKVPPPAVKVVEAMKTTSDQVAAVAASEKAAAEAVAKSSVVEKVSAIPPSRPSTKDSAAGTSGQEAAKQPAPAAQPIQVAKIEKSVPEIKESVKDQTDGARAMAKTETLIAAKSATDSRTIATLRAQNSQLKNDLRQAEARVDQLLSELDASRSQLATAEIEVNRLSALVDARNRNSLSKYSIPVGPAQENSRAMQPSRSAQRDNQIPVPSRSSAREVAAPDGASALPVATVAVDKADLRLGPGRNNSVLMSVSRGSRLLVEARQGEWYRVFAPSGERAWVHSSAVVFGEIPDPSNGAASRVKGYDADLEEEAFRKFNSGTGE